VHPEVEIFRITRFAVFHDCETADKSVTTPLQCISSPDVLRYEALLDQSFHRDLILLHKLKEIGSYSPPARAKASVFRAANGGRRHSLIRGNRRLLAWCAEASGV